MGQWKERGVEPGEAFLSFFFFLRGENNGMLNVYGKNRRGRKAAREGKKNWRISRGTLQ